LRSPAWVWVRPQDAELPDRWTTRIAPGEFYVMHHMNVRKATCVTEVQDGKRIQKFVFKGLTSR
jgi:hypothetical protein